MALKAVYIYGDQDPVYYTPTSDVAAGDIVDMGTMVGVAIEPIAANKLGAIATAGVYDILKKAGDVATLFGQIFWTVSTQTATITGPADALLGRAILPAASGDATVRVELIKS